MSIRANVGAVLLLAGLAGCSTASVGSAPDSDPRVARELLTTAARNGPVRIEVNALPQAADGGLTLAEVANQAARGIRVRTVSSTRRRPRRARPDWCCCSIRQPISPCGIPASQRACRPRWRPARARLQALFCDGATFIADATATTTDDTVAQLSAAGLAHGGPPLPDDYEHTFGLRQLGWPFGSDNSVKP